MSLSEYCENQSQMVLTLHRQIESLSPLRISYDNLSRYHNKITSDLESLIQEHDSAISSLRATAQNLSNQLSISESVRGEVIREIKDQQNEQAKLVLDMRNLGHKYESLSQKLQLEQGRQEQNISKIFIQDQGYKGELQNIARNVKTHIQSITGLNQKLISTQCKLQEQQKTISAQVTERKVLNEQISKKNSSIKQNAARLNIQNEDLSDCNRKFERELRQKEADFSAASKQNRNIRENLIQLKAQYESAKNQNNYKRSILTSESHTQEQFSGRESATQRAVEQVARQLASIQCENQDVLRNIKALRNTRSDSIQFKNNSQLHLEELKRANELLLGQMEQLCLRDRDIESLLMRKIQSLQYFSKKLSSQYEFDAIRPESSYPLKTVLRQRPQNETSSYVSKALSRQQSEETTCSKNLKQNISI